MPFTCLVSQTIGETSIIKKKHQSWKQTYTLGTLILKFAFQSSREYGNTASQALFPMGPFSKPYRVCHSLPQILSVVQSFSKSLQGNQATRQMHRKSLCKIKKKRHKMLSCEQWPNATLKSYEVRRILEWSIMEQVFTVQMWTTNRSRWNSRSTTLPDFAWSIAERRGTKDNHKRRKDFAPWFPLAWVVQELTPGQMLPVNDCLNAMLMPYDIPSTFEILFLQFTPNSSFDFRILKLGVFGIEGGLSISCFILLAGGSWLSRLSKSMEKLWAFGWSVDWIRPEAEGFLSPQKAPKKWRLQRHFCEGEILQCKQCLP